MKFMKGSTRFSHFELSIPLSNPGRPAVKNLVPSLEPVPKDIFVLNAKKRPCSFACEAEAKPSPLWPRRTLENPTTKASFWFGGFVCFQSCITRGRPTRIPNNVCSSVLEVFWIFHCHYCHCLYCLFWQSLFTYLKFVYSPHTTTRPSMLGRSTVKLKFQDIRVQ